MEDEKKEGVGVPVSVSGGIESVLPASDSPADVAVALRRVRVFADLPDDQLQWFASNVEDGRYTAGDVMFRKGDPPDVLVIYLEGEVHAYWDDNDHDTVYISRACDPSTEVSGMLPFSRMT